MASEVLSTETKFTPGPWSIEWYEPIDKDPSYVIVGPWDDEQRRSRIGVADVAVIDGKESPETKANARLMAAAPDLYEALTLIKRFGELACVDAGASFGGTSGKKPASKDVFQFPRHLLVEIDAALTRARGGSSNEGE